MDHGHGPLHALDSLAPPSASFALSSATEAGEPANLGWADLPGIAADWESAWIDLGGEG